MGAYRQFPVYIVRPSARYQQKYANLQPNPARIVLAAGCVSKDLLLYEFGKHLRLGNIAPDLLLRYIRAGRPKSFIAETDQIVTTLDQARAVVTTLQSAYPWIFTLGNESWRE